MGKLDKIPRIIHQIWLGESPENPAPMKWINTWKTKNPNYEHKLWTDKDMNDIPDSILELMNSTKRIIQKADILRYWVLYEYGGIYTDADSECVKPIESLIIDAESNDGPSIIVAYEKEKHRFDLIGNSFLASSAKSKYMAELVARLPTWIHTDKRPWMSTGPYLVTMTLREMYPDYKPLPWYYIYQKSTIDDDSVIQPCYSRQYWCAGRTNNYKAAT